MTGRGIEAYVSVARIAAHRHSCDHDVRRASQGRAMTSSYDDKAALEAEVRAGRHRECVGGLWEEVGQLQLDFLVAQGLMPHHRLLDIGCGSLRGGVKLIRYLCAGHYAGIDLHESLLNAGYEIELAREGLK